jgi:hypothetical protein
MASMHQLEKVGLFFPYTDQKGKQKLYFSVISLTFRKRIAYLFVFSSLGSQKEALEIFLHIYHHAFDKSCRQLFITKNC